jgi:Tfp pilus assembly protein PilO
MAMLPKDRRGQTLLALTIFAVAALYFTWSGLPVGDVPGVSQLGHQRDSLQRKIDSLQTQVRNAQADVRAGTVQQLERMLAEYRASLDMMRQLVPASAEVPNLIDDISSRAKVRGANVSNYQPEAVESGSPFDTHRYRFTVTGQYDQVGEFLSDIASLPRIIVPYNLRLERVQGPAGPASDTARNRGLLQASFEVRTYVKPQVDSLVMPPGAPARPGAPPGARPLARGGR